jgi:hypothetical protein
MLTSSRTLGLALGSACLHAWQADCTLPICTLFPFRIGWVVPRRKLLRRACIVHCVCCILFSLTALASALGRGIEHGIRVLVTCITNFVSPPFPSV